MICSRIVHQTVTLEHVLPNALRYFGVATLSDTWFPGYAWTIAGCRRCGSHAGWMFTRVDSQEVNDDDSTPSTSSIHSNSSNDSNHTNDDQEYDTENDSDFDDALSDGLGFNDTAGTTEPTANDNRVDVFW